MAYAAANEALLFRQLFHHESSTFTYLLACTKTNKAILIDPVLECVDRDLKLLRELELQLIFGVNTHVHADHITGTGKLKQAVKACKSVLGAKSGAKADIYLNDKDVLEFGELALEARSTPGHTNGCTTFVMHDQKLAFTGDALLIRKCGRTDFQQGSPATLWESVHSNIFTLPPHFKLYPAHDYTGLQVTTVAEELKHNTRLTLPKEKFVETMNNLNLSYPKKIDVSLPANLMCGILD